MPTRSDAEGADLTLVAYELDGAVATITLDDGKANVLSPRMQAEIHRALDRAEAAGAVVILSGRERILSGGFDLSVLGAGGTGAIDMVRGGFELAERLLSFPRPVVIACTGHAVAMGVFLLLSADYRIGVAGAHRITANEVAIGLTLPRAAIEICRHRLTPSAFMRATLLSEVFSPDDAVPAGFLDRVVPASDIRQAACDLATGLAKLDMNAHAATKLRVRESMLRSLRAAIEADDAQLRGLALA
jgi:enoyl-CoA hydratase